MKHCFWDVAVNLAELKKKNIDSKQILNTPLTYSIYTITGLNSYVR